MNSKILIETDFTNNELRVICEEHSYFNRTWKAKDSNIKEYYLEAVLYVKEILNKLNK